MRIIIFRHGEAEEKRPGISDEERRLTEKGRKDVECVAKVLPWKPSIIFTSPLIRAVETAKIVANIHGLEVVVDALRPEKTSLEGVKELQLVDGAVLVGHAPSIEKLVSELIGGGSIKLRAGSATGLEIKGVCRGCATLIFLITPDICSQALT